MFDFSPALIAVVGATFFAAGIVKGVTGMGLPTVVMGVLGSLISPVAAAALLVAPSIVTNVWQLVAGPSIGRLAARLWLMMVAIVVGTFAGISLLTSGHTQLTTGVLGVALALHALYTLWARPRRVPARAEAWLSPFVGLITGAISGGTGVSVIPAAPYIQALDLEKDDLVQALGLSFTVSTFSLAIGLALRGAFHPGNLALSALAIVPALAGMSAGQVIRRTVSPVAFRRGFLLCLLLLGVEMVTKSLLHS